LVHGEVELFDSTQIFEYFEHLQPQPPLWPDSVTKRAQARLLELKSDEVFFPHVIRLMGLQDRLGEPAAQEATARANEYYVQMDGLLADRDFLAGEYSYADIAFFMAQLFAARLGAPMDDATPRLLAWRMRVATRPAVSPVVRQYVRTLTGMGRPIPGFMSEVLASEAG
ncbi:MAG TPA: glutathione S-transferase family protein, partial [Xanthomonadaceae bacterium]|nr:glutathione S-transferase family protein [Xanthomonadaceae bacterium]